MHGKNHDIKIANTSSEKVVQYIYGNDSKISKFDSGGNYEEIELG
jgi:hypothetical protein